MTTSTDVRAIVTGASQGLGYAVAERFVAEGARVLLCARDGDALGAAAARAAGQRARRRTARRAGEPADVVGAADDVTRVVERTIAAFGGLDVLVCNAGVYGPIGPIEDVDWDEWVQAIEINLLRRGPVLPRGAAALPRAAVAARSSCSPAAARPSRCRASAPTPRRRRRVVRFGETLAEEVQGRRHRRQRGRARRAEHAAAGRGARGRAGAGRAGLLRAVARSRRRRAARRSRRGAALCAFLASAESDGITGRLISAVWDPWRELPGAARRARRHRHLHAAPHRPRGPRQGLGVAT